MFTQRQITLAGFLGVYSGCLPLTVNLARISFWRGAFIGVFFGSLTHVMMTLIYILLALFSGWMLDDRVLRMPETWAMTAAFVFIIHVICSAGCCVMGRYFMAPRKKSDPFEREQLHQRLVEMDLKSNPPGGKVKEPVLHSVTALLGKAPEYPDVRFSYAWIFLAGSLSLISSILWIWALRYACLEVLFMVADYSFSWYFKLVLEFLVPLIFLVVSHLSILAWLCRDKVHREATDQGQQVVSLIK